MTNATEYLINLWKSNDEIAREIANYEDDDDINQSSSSLEREKELEDLDTRKYHADLINDARQKFPTRAALEDKIRMCQDEVQVAVNSRFDVDRNVLSRAKLADDELRKILPLRLLLPSTADMKELIEVLQTHKEQAMRDMDMVKANSIQSEIDELQTQVAEEERFVMKKRMGETKCNGCNAMFTSEKIMKGILKVNQKHCKSCRDGRSEKPVVDSRDDQESS